MRYGRKQRREHKKERPFARRFKYESAKEGLGKLAEWGGAGVGMLLGLGAARLGLPIPTSVATTGGAILGGLVGAQGKAYVVARLDHLREQRDQRTAARAAEAASVNNNDGSRPPPTGNDRPTGLPNTHVDSGDRQVPRVPHRRVGSRQAASGSLAGQVISGLEKVLNDLDRTAQRVQQLAVVLWASHNSLSSVLAGGRPEVVRNVHDRMTTARNHVQDSAGLIRQASEALREYRRAI